MTLYDLLYYLLDEDTEVELWHDAEFIIRKDAHELMDYFGDFQVESFYPMTNGNLSVSIDTDGEDINNILEEIEEDEGLYETIEREIKGAEE